MPILFPLDRERGTRNLGTGPFEAPLSAQANASDPVGVDSIDLPTPSRGQRIAQLACDVCEALNLSLLHDVTKIFRDPFIVPRFIRFIPQPTFAINLLATTLAVVVADIPVQPAQASFPDPIRQRLVVQIDLPQAIDRTVTTVPFNQEEWSNPIRRTGVLSADTPLFFDRTPQGPAPFSQEEWPNPIRARKSVVPWHVRPDVDPATLPEGPQPFAQSHWLNPVKQKIRLSVVLVPPFSRSDAPPFIQSDWLNPVRVRPASQVFIPPVFDRSVTIATAPFTQTDWMNPTRRAARLPFDLPPVFDRSPLGPTPFAQTEWSNPTRRVLPTVWGSHSGLSYGDFTFVPPAPFSQGDWPNPTRRVLPTVWGSSAPLQYNEFVVVPPIPSNQFDWPNPTLRVFPTEWGFTSPLNYDEFVNTPLPPEPQPEPVIIIGGDDAPRKKPKTKKERHDLFREIEATVHQLLRPDVSEVGARSLGVAVALDDASERITELVDLAKGQQALLQRAEALRAEFVALQEQRQRELDQDEEDALLWLF